MEVQVHRKFKAAQSFRCHLSDGQATVCSFVLALQCWVFFRHVHFMHFLTSQISGYAFSDISDKWGLHPRSLEVWLFIHTKGAFINYQQGALISCKVLVRIQWPPYRRGCRFYDPPKGCFPTCTMPPPPDDWWSVPKGPFKRFYDSQWDKLSFLRTVERSLIMRISLLERSIYVWHSPHKELWLTASSTGHICNEGRISRSIGTNSVQWIHIKSIMLTSSLLSFFSTLTMVYLSHMFSVNSTPE